MRPWHAADRAQGAGSYRTLPKRQQLFAEYPELEEEDVRQVLAYAAANLDDKLISLRSAAG